MSSRNLISSLFQNKSQMRCSSLFHTPIPTSQSRFKQDRTRSYSNHSVKSDNNSKYLPLCRAVHLLSVKIKKINYFMFCKLQAAHKYDNLKPNINIIPQNSNKPEVSFNKNNQIYTKVYPEWRKVYNQALIKLEDSCQMLFYKYSADTLKKYSFKLIKNIKKKQTASKKFVQNIGILQRIRLKTAMSHLCLNLTYVLKIQIVDGAINNLLRRIKRHYFNELRQFDRKPNIHLIPQALLKIQQESFQDSQMTSSPCNNNNKELIGQNKIQRKQMKSSQIFYNFKFIAKIGIIQEQKRPKALKLDQRCFEESSLFKERPNIWKKEQIPMVKLQYLYSEKQPTNFPPDLNDNINFFNNFQQEASLLSKKQSLKYFGQDWKFINSIEISDHSKIRSIYTSQVKHNSIITPSSNASPFKQILKMMQDLQKMRENDTLFNQAKNTTNSSININNIALDSEQIIQKQSARRKSSSKQVSFNQVKFKQNFTSQTWKIKQIKDKYLFYPEHRQRRLKRVINRSNNTPEFPKNQKSKLCPLLTSQKMQIQIEKIINKKNKSLIKSIKTFDSGHKNQSNF